METEANERRHERKLGESALSVGRVVVSAAAILLAERVLKGKHSMESENALYHSLGHQG